MSKGYDLTIKLSQLLFQKTNKGDALEQAYVKARTLLALLKRRIGTQIHS
jgi:hypothetical protein